MADDNYTVTAQRQHEQINPSQTGFQWVWDISYKAIGGPANGQTGMITVPDSDHNAAYVDQAIRDKLSTLHGVASLGAKPVPQNK
jgi:hypothetical protein